MARLGWLEPDRAGTGSARKHCWRQGRDIGPAPAELALTDDDNRALLLALNMEHVAALAQVAEVEPQAAGSSRAVTVGAATAHQAPAQVGRVGGACWSS
jgi:hypothetical protein